MPSAPRPSPLAAGVVLVSLIVVLGLRPPETRGIAMAGAALLVLLSAVLGWRSAPASGARALAIAALLAIPITLGAQAPGAAVDPIAIALVAVGAGIAGHGFARSRGVPRTAAVALAVTAGVVALHAVYQKVWGLELALSSVMQDPTLPDHAALVARLESGRAFAAFITPAALGAYLALAMPVSVALVIETKRWLRAACCALVLVQVAGFVSTASATAAGALIAATALAACLGARSRAGAILATAAVGVLLAGVVVQRDGIALHFDDPRGPWQLRAGNFRAAWNMVQDHPWLGVGPGGFAERYPTYREAGDNEIRHVHDLPLELAAELGAPLGLLVSAIFFGVFLAPLARSTNAPAWRRGLAVGLAAFALHNLGDFTAFMPSLLWLAALLAGISLGSSAPASALDDTHEPGPAIELPDRLAKAVAWGAMLASVAIAGAGGVASEARLDARYAVVDPALQRRLAERSQRLAPWQPDSALFLARVLERAEGTDSVAIVPIAERAVQLSPVRPAARELRARVRLARGDVEGAHADLVEARRLYPGHTGYAQQERALRARLERHWIHDESEP